MPYQPVARKPCEVCGVSQIPVSSKTGVCNKTLDCRREYRRRMAEIVPPYVPAARVPCDVCKRPIPVGTTTGVCQRTKDCKKEYVRRFHAKHPLWQTYQGIRTRCLRDNHQSFENYGARGIKLYEPWINDFAAFETWMDENLGPRPEGMTLDRKDNDGNYEPGNLQWASAADQWKNSRHIPSPINRLRQQVRDLGGVPCY